MKRNPISAGETEQKPQRALKKNPKKEVTKENWKSGWQMDDTRDLKL